MVKQILNKNRVRGNKLSLYIFVIVNLILFKQGEFLSAQVLFEEESVRIGNITVQGNIKTKPEIIVRELEFKTGDLVQKDQLELARKRIENLNLFNRVIFNFEDIGEQKDLNIVVWERWYLYPTPIFFINEHDWNKLSYGLGVFHANFRGRGENLWFAGWFGYNPGLNFSYSNRWFGGRHRLYSNFSLRSQKVESKTLIFPDQKEYHRSVSLLFGKKYGIHWYSDVEVKLKFINTDQRLSWGDRDNQDRVLGTMFKLQLDTRDLWQYPGKGNKISFSYSRSFLINGQAAFNKWQLDWRGYRTFWNIILAGRLFGETTQGHLPIYEHLYIGYGERVRGYFQKIYEGENRILTSVECRFPLLKERYFQIPSDSWLISYFQQMNFGIYVTLFRDAGAVWYQKEKLNPNLWQSGMGIGLNFILPYSNILRLEYAFDESGQPEYIFDVNVAF